MPGPRLTLELRRRRRALFLLFGLPGLTIASWVARTPDVRDLLHASTAQMGLVLFGVSVGSMSGVLASSALIARLGTRTVIVGGSASTVLSMPVVGVGAELHEPAVVAVGLALFGLGLGVADVALNFEATVVERASGVSVLPPMHGCFSVGTTLGALTGVACTLTGVPVGAHLGVVGALGALVATSEVRHLSRRTRRGPSRADRANARGPRPWRDPRLLLIGVVALAMGLGEGTAVDWLPLVMVDGHDASAAVGSAVFTAFAACMAVGRFTGPYVVDRLGPAGAVRWTGAAAALGIGCIALVDSLPVVTVAVVLWGLGVSLGFPIAISAAGASGTDAAARVSLVAVMGYVSLLAGPPSLGFVGEHHGLRSALLLPLALLLLAVVLAPALEPRRPARRTTALAAVDVD
jgi:fucose permease